MAQNYSNSWKNCATCAFWCGARQCDTFGIKVTVEGSSTRGRCSIPSGGWKGQERQASAGCNDWQKWPVLR